MGKGMYKGAATRDRLVRSARKSPHPAAIGPIKPIRHTFEIGDPVRVKRNKFETKIVAIASWGDYQVEGVNGYYSSFQLEPR